MNYTSTLAFAAALVFGAAPRSYAVIKSSSPITIGAAGPVKAWLKVEAFSDQTVRLWFSDSPTFSRKPSLAMETASPERVALRKSVSSGTVTLATGRLLVRVDPLDLETSVLDARTHQILIGPLKFIKGAGEGWTIKQHVTAAEHFMGLGQDNRNQGKLDRRGTIRTLWAGQQIRSGDVTADYPIPFTLSTGAKSHSYGLFLDDVHRLTYDLCKSQRDEVKVTADGGDADLYVLDGPTPKDVISRYTSLTGRPSLPPLWTLGYIQSRCVFYDWNDVDGAYNGLRSRGFPVDALVIDYQWPEYLNDFVWDKRWTVNGVTPAERVKAYSAKGINLMLYGMSPMVVKDSPTHKTGLDSGVFALDASGHTLQAGYYNGDLLDFTAPKMNQWLWPQLHARNIEGIDSWWLDLTEPEGEPPQTIYKGGRPSEIHNQFSILVSRSFEGSLLKDHPTERPWILTRAGSAGIQRYGAALWTGDINSDYATLAAHPGEMLNSGISGVSQWTCDTGGFLTGFYKNDQFGAHARLYERWMQFSAFSPITRAHKAGLCMPYEFGLATEQGTKKYINLRYQLLPYIYSHVVESSETGIPIVRSMGVEFPNDPGSVSAKGDQYMFGKNLLVAPVLNEGISKRPVYFPPGMWIDWDTGVEYSGGKTWVVAAPQNRIPVAIRAGAIIPMAPEMANTAQGKWDPLTVEVYPKGNSSFTMVRDDGRSFDYLKGKRTRTVFTSSLNGNSLTFKLAESNRLFVPKMYVLRFHLDRAPTSSKGWDAKNRTLTIPVVEGGKAVHSVSVNLSPVRLPSHRAPILVADKVVTGKANPGSPMPHFFPAPVLPSKLTAANYDNGGEGVAYHRAQPSSSTLYRTDNAGVLSAKDGNGYIVGGLQKGDWLRYSIDAGNGGYYDLVFRVSGDGALRLLSSDRDVMPMLNLGKKSGLQEIRVPNVYLNPGSDSLMLFAVHAGFELSSIEFSRPAAAPPTIEARWAAHTGQVVAEKDGLGNVGQLSGTVTFSLNALAEGSAALRIRYSNNSKDMRFELAINGKPMEELLFPKMPEDGYIEVPANLLSGPNKFEISWKTNTYDSIQLKNFEIVSKAQ